MQEALTISLAALGTLAADGVLPYREDPLVLQARRAAPANDAGSQAIAALGGRLRRAAVHESRAPQLRDTIAETDAPLQALVAALITAVAGQEAMEAEERHTIAAEYERL